MRIALAAGILLVAGTPAFGHRLDEYLQGTLISVEKNSLHAEMTLTPGVAVFPFLISSIDTDADGAISQEEQAAYARSVLRDLSLSIDGQRVTPRLRSLRFPTIGEMKEGRGEIHLDVDADLPAGGRNRNIQLENRHQSKISAYQVNCLIPRDLAIHIAVQHRNYSQSLYRLEYADTDVRADSPLSAFWSGGLGWLGAIALVLCLRALFLWRQRAGRPGPLPENQTFAATLD